jgi:flavin reductase (DIM6/NTAB) family NADH-FMN oxidoreductase RutF
MLFSVSDPEADRDLFLGAGLAILQTKVNSIREFASCAPRKTEVGTLVDVDSDTGVAWFLEQLWAPIVAVTAAHEGRGNGLISSTALTASLLPEAPRIAVHLSKASFTHELVLASGSFAVHLLPRDALDVVHALGMTSGRDGDKLAGLPTRPGVTGSPVLIDAVAYIEGRVAQSLDGGDVMIVLADVVAGARLRDEPLLTIELLQEGMPPEWQADWELRRENEMGEARRLRHSRQGLR